MGDSGFMVTDASRLHSCRRDGGGISQAECGLHAFWCNHSRSSSYGKDATAP